MTDRPPLPGLCPTDKKPCIGDQCQSYATGYERGIGISGIWTAAGFTPGFEIPGYWFAFCSMAPDKRMQIKTDHETEAQP